MNLVVLISGGGTTLENLIRVHQAGALSGNLVGVISSHRQVRGNEVANHAGLPLEIVDHREFSKAEALSERLFAVCRNWRADLVVCGGFLRRLVVPPDFTHRVINIHPSLIPAFCGRGFYGIRVHQAVLDYGCRVSGCTVHFVDNEYDHGPIIAQRAVAVLPDDTAERLQQRVFAEECKLYPEVINGIAQGGVSVCGRQVRIAQAKPGG